MQPRDLADLVDRIAEAVDAVGKTDRAAWLRTRADDLRHAEAAQIARTHEELAGVVHGMGGLLDMHFGAATGDVEALIDLLWTAVKP